MSNCIKEKKTQKFKKKVSRDLQVQRVSIHVKVGAIAWYTIWELHLSYSGPMCMLFKKLCISYK